MNTDFSEYLDRITESDEFGEIIDPNQIGPIFNSAVDAFAGANKIEDKTELYNQASKRHNDWKHKYNVTRFIPTGDDFDTYYEKFESPDGKLEDKIKYVDEWINRSVDKASSIRPTERDDFRNHLVMLGNNYIREEAAKEATPGWVNDKLKRIIQSPIKPVYDIFDWEGSQRFFAENLVENPEMDEDLSSKFAAGIGELGSQLTIGAALYASGAGASIPYVFGALYGTRYFNEGFRQELDRTGDAERAVFHGITQLPAAALDTFSDVFLLKSGSVGKTFYKEFLSATTEEAKRNVLKRAIPSVLKEGGIQFTSEGIIGGAMADASSGVGSFLATGDQKYLDNALSIKNLAESAFIEGTLGGVAGVGISSFAKEENLQNLSNQIRTLTLSNQQQQSSVLGMLKTKDYDGVLKFLEENKQVENENDYDAAIDLLKEERRINTSGQKTNKERVAESDIKNFEYERFLSKKIDEIEKISNKEEREFRQQDIDRYNNIIKSIKDGSFTEKTEFESDIDLDAASRYTWKGHNPNKDTDTGAYETLLDNGELSEDGVIYIEPNKFINQKTFNALSMEHGKDPSIIFSPNKDTAKVIIPGTNNGSQEFRSSTSPKKGWIAISSVFDGGKSKVKILGTVSEYNKINFKPGDYEITSRDSDSITVKTKDGKSHKLTGDSRNFVSDQQDYLKSKENTKILKREEETFNEAGALYEQALTKREWSEKEKQDFLSKVDKAVDFLGRLADTEINPEFQDAYLESAIQLLDAKERLSKINVKKSNIAALFEPIESDYNEIEEQEVRVDSSSAVDISTTPIAQSKKKYPHTLSLDDTIETAENRGVYYDGKQGKIINDNGDYVFVSNSGTQYTLTRNKDITLRDAGVSVSRKNPQKPNILKPIKATKPDRPNIAEPFEGDPKEIPPQTEEEQPSIQPEPSIRLPYINHALKLARSIDNRLNGDYLVNNKFTKEEIDIISKEAGVDVSDIQDDYYSIADRINSKLGREQEKADKIKDREFEVTGDKLNPNSYRNFRKSLNTKEHNSRKRKIITELQDKYNYKKVTIIDSVSDIPKELMEDGFEDADAIVDKDGRIYFVLENIAPEQGQYLSDKIEKLFAHELVGHLGVSGLLKGISQKSYDSLVKLLKNHNDGSIWNYIKEKYKGQEEYILIEEALAFIAERKTPEYVSLFQRIIDLIRVSLAKAGLKNWSKNDVNSLIRRAFVERKFDKGLGFDPRVIDSTPRSVTRGSRVSYGDIANHTLKGSYGAWIDKSGNMIIVNGDAMSFPHYEAALKELKEEDSQDISGVYERMYEKGYVSIRKNNGEGYVEAGTGRNLTISQKATLENIGINDEIRIILDNGVSGTKTIYSPPTANDLARFSKKQENGRIYDISNVSNKNIRFSKASENTARFNELTDDLYQGRDSATQDDGGGAVVDGTRFSVVEKSNPLDSVRDQFGPRMSGHVNNNSFEEKVLGDSQALQRGYPEEFATIGARDTALGKMANGGTGVRSNLWEHLGDLYHRAGSTTDYRNMRSKVENFLNQYNTYGIQASLKEQAKSNAIYKIARERYGNYTREQFDQIAKSAEGVKAIEDAERKLRFVDAAFASMYERMQAFTPLQAMGRNMAIAFGLRRYAVAKQLGDAILAAIKPNNDAVVTGGFNAAGVNNLTKSDNQTKQQWDNLQKIAESIEKGPLNSITVFNTISDRISDEELLAPIKQMQPEQFALPVTRAAMNKEDAEKHPHTHLDGIPDPIAQGPKVTPDQWADIDNKDIRYSKADLLSLPDSALSKTGKEFATIVDNMRRSDGSTFIKKETKTPEQLNEIAKEIITLAKNNPEYFTVKINPEKLIYDHLFQDANGKIDMDDPIDSIRASEESKMLWSLFKDGRIKEYAEKEAIELTNQRNITLRENASYLAENPEYTNFESAQILIAMSKIAIKDLPNGEYQSVEISSGNRQAVMPLDGEYASYIRDEIRNGKTAKVAVKDGYIAVQENAKLNNKSIKNGWIMLNKSDNSEDAAKLAKLCSGTGWCVSNNNTAASYLSRGDFWIYFKDGKVQIGIGYASHEILERPRGTLRGQSLSDENEKIAEQKIRIDKIKGGEDFLYDRDLKKKLYKILKSNEKPTIEEIKDFILLTDKEFDVIINFKTYSYTKDTNTEKLRNLLKDKISKLFEYSDFIKTNEDGSINVLCSADLINSKVLEKIQSVGGGLYTDSLTEAPLLQSVGGDLSSRSLTEAPLLQSVGGYLHSDSLTEAPLLQSVGGSLRSDSLTKAPLLQSVGGYLSSYNLTEAPLLQSVGGGLIADNLTEAPLLQSVGGYLHSNSLTEAPLLQSVGGYLHSNSLTEAPLLQSVGGGLIADNLTEAPLLQSVGGDLHSNSLTKAPLLQSVGGSLYTNNLTEAPLLQSIGGGLSADSLTEAPLLQSVGGGLSASSLKHAPLLTNVNNKEFTPIDNINKYIRYSKTQTEEFNESLFDSLTYFSDKKIEDRREISKLKGAKLEQKLIIGEKSVLDALKSINHLYLDSNHLDRYKKLLANFVDTRRRVDNPPLNREELNNITVELAEIARHQNEQIYTKYRQEFPDIDSENFRDEDGNLDMEKLHDWFKSRIALDESLENPRLVSENHKEYIDAVYKLQEQLLEDINNPDSKVYDLINNTIATETDDPILKHGNTIINERFERIRDYLKDFVNQTVSFDPKDATFKEVRLQYYSLMSILGDGYPLNNGTFISSRIKEIFENEGNFINPFSKRSQESYITNVQSFGTKLRSLVADGKTLEFLYGIISPFREGITESQRWTNDVARPYIESALKRAEKINGRHFNNYDRIKMGIYSILRQHGVDEHPGMALRKNIEWIKASINNYRNSYDKTFVRAAEEQSSLLELLTSGIDFDSDYAILNMEENAKEYLGDGAIQFVDDLVKLFNQLKPLSRLTTEFIYGRKFNEIVNYLPTMQIITKGSHYAEVDFADLELTSDGDSILRSNVGVRNIINTSGMSSTQDRMRKIGENRAIVLDIVHMADNAGRLNSIDYFTSFERKEIQGMQNSRTKIGKQLAKFFGDEKADLGRVSVFNNATRTMWHNEIENSSFIAPIQGVINKLINLWSRSKLSSIHQFFTQTASNYIPFIIRNISNPKKIGYSIDAANLLTRYNLGLLPDNLNKIIERITYEIRHRVQDVVLEKSVSLNVSGKEIKDWINGTSLYHSIKHLDSLLDKIMFAPFKGSDYLSGAPILLSEYLDREISNNRATSFEDMTYNQESHMIAVDEMERFIGIGNASRRGDWLHNKNGMISVARNLLVAFSSHRINNATNFAIEAKKLMEDRVNGEEKINSIKYMTGIAAQSIVFNGLKAVINFMIAKLIIKALRSDDDDDLKSLYESTPTSSKEERRLIDAEISLRRKLRKQVNNIRNRASDKNIIAINMGKDMVYNMFIPINAIDGGADMLIHYFYDKHSEELFKENKKNELQRLRDEYKKEAIYGDTPSSLSIKQEISDLESQVYIPVSFESRSVAPLGGSYGGVVKGIEDFLSRSTDYFIKGEPVSMADMLSIASILGASQPDLLKAAKEFEKLSDAKLERDEKIQEIKEEEEEPFFVF